MYAKDCAKALGVTDSKKIKDGSISTTVRWNRVYDDLVSIGKFTNLGIYRNLDNAIKKDIRCQLNTMKLTKEEVIIWSKKVNTNIANDFIQILIQLNKNNIKNIIIKEYRDRKEIEFFKL
jgi:hypothetical protein